MTRTYRSLLVPGDGIGTELLGIAFGVLGGELDRRFVTEDLRTPVRRTDF